MKTVNRHLARIFAIVLSAIMLVSNTGAIETKAAVRGFELGKDSESLLIVNPGQTNHFSIPVTARSSSGSGSMAFFLTSISAEANNESLKIENLKILNSDGTEIDLKKSSGESTSVIEEVAAYAQSDREEIIRELQLIDPDIVICGSTFWILYQTY